jgi:hypothetical protein
MAQANEVMSPRLGLPDLPVVTGWTPTSNRIAHALETVLLSRWAARRPLVWLDAEITDADRRWVAAAHHPTPTLLHRVDPCQGLTDAHFDTEFIARPACRSPLIHCALLPLVARRAARRRQLSCAS